MMTPVLSRAIVGAIGILLTACGGDTQPVTPAATGRLHIVHSIDTLNAVGDTLRLTVTIDSAGQPVGVRDGLVWASFAPGIIKVSPSGLVTSKMAGVAQIVVTRYGLADTAVLVSRQVAVSLTTTWTTDTVFLGDSIAVVATGRDSNGVNVGGLGPLHIRSVSGPALSLLSPSLLQASQPGSVQVVADANDVGTASVQLSVLVESPFIGIAAGNGFSCGLVERGVVYCWGDKIANSGRPRAISGLPPLMSISAGVIGACGLSAAGAAYCWSSTTNAHVAAAPQPLVSLSTGYDFTCGLSADGSSYCWGGPFGSPTPLRTLAPALQSISSGNEQACGLSSGSVLCWVGEYVDAAVQQLGATGGFKSVAVGTGVCAVRLDDVATCFSGLEQSATTMPPASDVAVGDGSACILRTDRTAMCWGTNYFGELGTGTRSDSLIPQPVPAVAGIQLRSITLGTGLDYIGRHSCGLDMTGHAFCWGDNTLHQIGAPGWQQLFNNHLLTLAPARVTRTRLQ